MSTPSLLSTGVLSRTLVVGGTRHPRLAPASCACRCVMRVSLRRRQRRSGGRGRSQPPRRRIPLNKSRPVHPWTASCCLGGPGRARNEVGPMREKVVAWATTSFPAQISPLRSPRTPSPRQDTCQGVSEGTADSDLRGEGVGRVKSRQKPRWLPGWQPPFVVGG